MVKSIIEEVVAEVGTTKHVVLAGVPVVSEEDGVERVQLWHIVGRVGVAQVESAEVVVVGVLVGHERVVRVCSRVDVVRVLEA